jgi:hypothetical protein
MFLMNVQEFRIVQNLFLHINVRNGWWCILFGSERNFEEAVRKGDDMSYDFLCYIYILSFQHHAIEPSPILPKHCRLSAIFLKMK